MKRLYFSKLITLAALLMGSSSALLAQAPTVFTFTAPGGVQTYQVGLGVTAIAVDMAGGKGGDANCSGIGGKGGRLQCDLAVTPGQILYVYVGGAGANYSSGTILGGFNGGGNGYQYGGGGGGGSDISTNLNATISSRTRLAVAGGGGGSGYWNYCNEVGGDGGGLTGKGGVLYSGAPASYGGTGGTQNAGGNYAQYGSPYGASGTFGYGGSGYIGGYASGGGGGGYFGGGGGDYQGAPGGGGSSFTIAGSANIIHTQGYSTGNGYVSITALVPIVISAPASLNFGAQTVGIPSVPKVVSLTGLRLTGFPSSVTATAPAGYLISTDGILWGSTKSIFYGSATMAATNLYVQFVPAFATSYCGGSISVTGGGQPTPCLIPLCGNGVSACSSTPVAGTATSSVTSSNSSSPITLNLTGTTSGGSITYQWQQSIDAGATWTDIIGGVTIPYTKIGITSNTMFRCKVGCPSAGTSNSTTVSVTYVSAAMASAICTNPTSSSLCTGCGFWVANTTYPFVINGDGGTKINDNNAPGTWYYNYTSSQSVNMTAGNTYSFTNSYAPINSEGLQIWIDFNNNGDFDPTESVGGGNFPTGTPMPLTPFTIPANAPGGIFRMRVVVDYNSGCSGSYPCYPNLPWCSTTSYGYTETRDYTAIIAPPKCTGTPNPGIAFTPTLTNCGPLSANLYNIGATGLTTATGISYQWQSSPDASTWTDIAGADNPTHTQLVSATMYYRAKTTCLYGTSAITAPPTLISINTQPVAITGTSTFCSATPSALTCLTPGGSWSSSNPAIASVDAFGLVTGLSGGTATISYTMPTGCFSSKVVTVYLSPGAVSGSSNLCTTQSTTLSNATLGGIWTSSNPAVATIGSSSGTVTGVVSGIPYITYTIPAGGCYTTFPMVVTTLPAPITGSSSVCTGSTTALTSATAGGTWASSNSFQASVTPSTGLVSGLLASNPDITYTLPGGCYAIKSMVVNALPNPISGSSNVCVASSTSLSSTTLGGLWSSSNPSVATVVPGTGSVTGVAAGTANIMYTDGTTGCSTGALTTVNALPAVYTVGGGGGYCAGSSGAHITLSGSVVGVNYNLYYNGVYSATLAGSAAGLDFGAMTGLGTYTVLATDATTLCNNNMSGAAVVSVNALPVQQTLSALGTGAYCFGGTGVNLVLSTSESGVSYQLWNGSTAVGIPVAGTGSGMLDLGFHTGAGTYAVTALNTSTLCSETMLGSPTISINTPPTMYTVTSGGTSYCAGGAGIDVSMSSSDIGITYTLLRNAIPTATITSTGGTFSFGNQTGAGSYTVIASDVAGCSSTMPGGASISIDPLPAPQTVTGGGNYCIGTGGKHIGLAYSVSGITYELHDGSGIPVKTLTGANSGLDFGSITNVGNYTVLAINPVTTCNALMSGTVTVGTKPLPTPYLVTDGGGYCAGDPGKHVSLLTSDLNVKYQLYRDGFTVGTPVAGTNMKLDFGIFANPGLYTVVATGNTTGCTNNMTGSTTISINPLPLVYTVKGGGGYCATGTGREVTLSGSELGVDYLLLINGVSTPPAVSGTGSPISFGDQVAAGVYTVLALNTTTTCQKMMTGSAVITINPLPVDYALTGGGSYCAGAPGVLIGSTLSASGIEYQLLNSGVPSGMAQGGTGMALNFGLKPGGTYTLRATNLTTGCVSTGTSLNVTMNTPPSQYTVSGGGSICAGDTRHVNLSSSDASVDYQLYRGTTGVGLALHGGTALDFGAYGTAGAYTVIGTDLVTGCTSTMVGTATINVIPAPTVYTVSGGGSRCGSGIGLAMNLSGSDLGSKYEVYKNGTLETTYYAGTGLPIYLGLHADAGTYKVVATAPTTGCTSNMNDSAMVTIRPSNTPAIVLSADSGTDTVCAGTETLFTSAITNGGTSPKYTWKVNGITTGSASSLKYEPKDGDVITAILTSNVDCPTPATVSDDMTMTVMPNVMPAATVTATPSTFVCPGTAVTFTAKATNGGSAPYFSWIRNGVPVGTGTTYTYTPMDSIVVFAQLVSNAQCRTTGYVLSNNVAVAINEPVLPDFMISEISSTTVNTGGIVILKAIVANKGSFTYQWYVNGKAIDGETKAQFTHNYYASQEVVKCVVTSHGVCGGLSATQSKVITVMESTAVKTVGANADVKLIPNPNKGTFAVKGTLGTTIDQEVTLEITNMLGQTVYSTKVMTQNGVINEQVQLANTLANGMYLLNLRSGSNLEVFHFVLEQ